MKIVIATGLYPPEIGGPATYAKLFEERLQKYGIEVSILPFSTVRHLPQIIRHIAYFWKTVRLSRNVDAILVQDTVSTGFPAAVASLLVRKPLILRVPGDYAWEQGAQRFGVKEVLDEFLDRQYGFMVECFRFLEKFVAGRADKIIVPSEYLKKVVMKWGVAPEKIKVIYNAFEPPRSKEITPPAPLTLRVETRTKLSINQNDKIIVSAGRLVPWKGFDVLIEIMPEILEKELNAKLIIIGDGPEKERLLSLKAQIFQDFSQRDGARLSNLPASKYAGLEKFGAEAIAFRGNLQHEKVLEYLAAADVFALNTSYEGLSHQILEAMAVGCPVVTTDVGGNPELIKDGESGFLVKFNDKNALKSTILKILNDMALAQKLAENAQKKAGEFSKERMINETINLIKNICEF